MTQYEYTGYNNVDVLFIDKTRDGYTNVAAGRPTRQSSVDDGASADRANDGEVNGHYYKGSCTLTADPTNNPWWAVDLDSKRYVRSVIIYNRVDGNYVHFKIHL